MAWRLKILARIIAKITESRVSKSSPPLSKQKKYLLIKNSIVSSSSAIFYNFKTQFMMIAAALYACYLLAPV